MTIKPKLYDKVIRITKLDHEVLERLKKAGVLSFHEHKWQHLLVDWDNYTFKLGWKAGLDMRSLLDKLDN